MQYYRLVNQETDSDGERTHERAKVVPSSENPPKKSSGKEGSPPVQGWTTRATCLGFALVLALMLLIVLLFVALRPASTYNRNPPPPKTCQSTSCIEVREGYSHCALRVPCGTLLDFSWSKSGDVQVSVLRVVFVSWMTGYVVELSLTPSVCTLLCSVFILPVLVCFTSILHSLLDKLLPWQTSVLILAVMPGTTYAAGFWRTKS